MANPEKTNLKIAIEVVYATPEKQSLLQLAVNVGSTIEAAIYASGILQEFPEIDLSTQKVGIFSIICDLSTQLKTGDRVEIYRPLTIDPKEARRLRAKKQKKLKT